MQVKIFKETENSFGSKGRKNYEEPRKMTQRGEAR